MKRGRRDRTGRPLDAAGPPRIREMAHRTERGIEMPADHFYTTSITDRDNDVVTYGYQYEQVACYVFNYKAPGTTEFWRLYNPQTGYHFYTASADERNIDLSPGKGWVVEPNSPVACYVFNS